MVIELADRSESAIQKLVFRSDSGAAALAISNSDFYRCRTPIGVLLIMFCGVFRFISPMHRFRSKS